jgi:4-hydroxybenzoyl-CoA thioesterase
MTEANKQPRSNTYQVHVEFGDCDPARIVWFPNFFRWIDAASRHFFTSCGIPLWHELEKTRGIIGTPLVDTHARFVKTASNDDLLEIHTSIVEWRDKSFVQRHRILRTNAQGEQELIMECDEVRIFATRRESSATGIRALPIPADIRALCE